MKRFQQTVWEFYEKNKRSLPWRPGEMVDVRVGGEASHPKPLSAVWEYKILVSEIMLQQTQVDRVTPKFKSFIKRFPNFRSLASASTVDVLKEWQGLGYNSRGLRLKKCAEVIIEEYGGRLPGPESVTKCETDGVSKNKRNRHVSSGAVLPKPDQIKTAPPHITELQKLPGIGPYTAGALSAFIFNIPYPIIETNIRTVYFHHFFKNKTHVSDAELLKKVQQTLPENDTRNWYYALMDYGSYIKKQFGNNIRQSKHYTKQSTFKGSNREVRSMILKTLLKLEKATPQKISKHINKPLDQVSKNMTSMQKEGLLNKSGKSYRIED